MGRTGPFRCGQGPEFKDRSSSDQRFGQGRNGEEAAGTRENERTRSGIVVDCDLDNSDEIVAASLNFVDIGRSGCVRDEPCRVVGGQREDLWPVEGVEAAAALGVELTQKSGFSRLPRPVDDDDAQVFP